MSNKQSFVFLNEVKPYKNNWRVHVKVLHSWKSNTKFGESLECILTDQQVTFYMSYYLNDYWYHLFRYFRVENFTLLPKGIRCIVHKEIFLLENGDLLRCLRFPLLEVNIEHQGLNTKWLSLARRFSRNQILVMTIPSCLLRVIQFLVIPNWKLCS